MSLIFKSISKIFSRNETPLKKASSSSNFPQINPKQSSAGQKKIIQIDENQNPNIKIEESIASSKQSSGMINLFNNDIKQEDMFSKDQEIEYLKLNQGDLEQRLQQIQIEAAERYDRIQEQANLIEVQKEQIERNVQKVNEYKHLNNRLREKNNEKFDKIEEQEAHIEQQRLKFEIQTNQLEEIQRNNEQLDKQCQENQNVINEKNLSLQNQEKQIMELEKNQSDLKHKLKKSEDLILILKEENERINRSLNNAERENSELRETVQKNRNSVFDSLAEKRSWDARLKSLKKDELIDLVQFMRKQLRDHSQFELSIGQKEEMHRQERRIKYYENRASKLFQENKELKQRWRA